jgi:UDP-N-acetylglucosamine 2-epimerase (non-hydrolysing)
VTEESGVENLVREGKPRDRIHFVGHVMIDNLLHQLRKLEHDDTENFSVSALKKDNSRYAFLTLHRPSNVDDRATFEGIVDALNVIPAARPVFFPMHPRTRKMAELFGITFSVRIFLLPPLNFQSPSSSGRSRGRPTDSGGPRRRPRPWACPASPSGRTRKGRSRWRLGPTSLQAPAGIRSFRPARTAS